MRGQRRSGSPEQDKGVRRFTRKAAPQRTEWSATLEPSYSAISVPPLARHRHRSAREPHGDRRRAASGSDPVNTRPALGSHRRAQVTGQHRHAGRRTFRGRTAASSARSLRSSPSAPLDSAAGPRSPGKYRWKGKPSSTADTLRFLVGHHDVTALANRPTHGITTTRESLGALRG